MGAARMGTLSHRNKMARGPKRHLKRLNAPKHWMLDKMGGTWAPRPSTGPHKLRECHNCSPREVSVFSPPAGQTCGEYLAPYLQVAPGTLQNPDATVDCQYCSLSNADQFAAQSNIYWSTKWRDYGIFWAFIVFNAFIAVLTYWAFRVKKWKGISFPTKKRESKKDKNVKKKEHSSHMNIFRK